MVINGLQLQVHRVDRSHTESDFRRRFSMMTE
jgi:hypothetical protein